MQWPCCHSCMLSNGTDGIILWLMKSPGFSSLYYYVVCGRYREITWSQNRDLIFGAKHSCLQSYAISAASILLTDSQIIQKMNSAYFVTNMLILLEQAIFPWGRAPHEKRLVLHLDNCSVHTCRVSTDWLEEHSILCMPYSQYSPYLASIDFYLFPTVKERLERIQLADEGQFFECL
jgi:hypothetical protein